MSRESLIPREFNGKKIDTSYYNWLLYELGVVSYYPDWRDMFNILYTMDYFWFEDRFPRDKNRAVDGIEKLRARFYNDPDAPELKEPCTVLEMMGALAIREDLEYDGDPGEPNPGRFLTRMLHNMGLMKYKGSLDGEAMSRVEWIVMDWLNREAPMERHPFPIPRGYNDCPDQNSVEFWEQMTHYVFYLEHQEVDYVV